MNQVGIVKQLTYDPKISNIYGFIDANKKGNGSTTQYDFSELINVNTTTHSDPPRISMQSVQQKHIISIKDQDPLLIGSGVEKMAPYMISDEFAFKAKEDGKVESIDYKNEVAILKYKSGKTDLVDLSTYECCNSNGGLNKGFTLNTFNCWNILILNKDNQQRSFLIIKEERSTTIEKYNFIYYTK